MRRLFVVLAKLVGLVQSYRLINSAVMIAIQSYSLLKLKSGRDVWWDILAPQLILVVYFAVTLVASLFLLFKTEWIANLLRIPNDEPIVSVGEEALMRTGMKLIGLWMSAHAIPTLVRHIYERTMLPPSVQEVSWMPLCAPVVQLGLGLFLIFQADRLNGWFGGERQESPT